MGLYELLITTFIAALITDLATGLGAVPFFFVRDLSAKLEGAFTAAAGGMMIAASLVQLVGEALHHAPGVRAWEVATGVAAGAAFFGAAANWLHTNEDFDFLGLRKKGGSAALLIVIAMTLHSLPEGIAVGVGYGSNDPRLGFAVAIAIAIHNIPEGVAITLALRPKGVSTWGCMGLAILTSVPQVLGAVPAAWAVWIFEPLLPAGMGFAAGAMTYLVVGELLPDATKDAGKHLTPIAFIAGIVLMMLMGVAVGLG